MSWSQEEESWPQARASFAGRSKRPGSWRPSSPGEQPLSQVRSRGRSSSLGEGQRWRRALWLQEQASHAAKLTRPGSPRPWSPDERRQSRVLSSLGEAQR